MEQTINKTEQSDEINTLWQEYLQKACEVGQLDKHLEDLDSRKKELEKQLEVTKRARNSAAHKHDQLMKSKAIKPLETPAEAKVQ